jgi:CheY-like chemotaxis protein
MTNSRLTAKNSQKGEEMAGEILDHAEYLLDSTLTTQQRDRLTRIRITAQSLVAQFQQETHTNQRDTPLKEQSHQDDNHISPLRPLKILLAEDNPFTQKLMSRLLIQNHHSVVVVTNGQAVLEQLQNNKFDLILMDIRMPIMDGIQTCEAIRKQERESGQNAIPIIAVTALVDEADKNRIFKSGINGYHGKPVRTKVLNQEMERVLQIRPDEEAMKKNKKNKDPAQADLPVVKLDIDRLLKTVDNDWVLIEEITNLFFTDAPKQLQRIKKAIEEENTEELLEAAHSLKGAAGAFGKNMVYDIAYKLEIFGRDKRISSAQEDYHLLKEALVAMEQSLKDTLAKNGDNLS